MPISPWLADSLTHVQGTNGVEPVYSVYLGLINEGVPGTYSYWDVEVTLDGGRRPYATARFKASMNVMDNPEAVWGAFRGSAPYKQSAVQIKAGYRRAGVSDLQWLFYGYITSRTVETDGDGNKYVQFEAESADTWIDLPSNRADYDVGSTLTSIEGVFDYLAVNGTALWHHPGIDAESGFMNTPTAGQLTAFRGLSLKNGDGIADFIVSMAAALGQWARPDIRQVNTPTMIICADPYPYRAATALATKDFEKLTRVESADQWANVLELTCTWVDGSNDSHTKKRTYTNGTPDGSKQIRVKAVTVNAYPPGGSMPATYALATAWLRRVQDMQEVKYTGTSRAMHWLQPRIDGINLTDNAYGDTAGPIDAITFKLDAGLQTVTWTAANPYI